VFRMNIQTDVKHEAPLEVENVRTPSSTLSDWQRLPS